MKLDLNSEINVVRAISPAAVITGNATTVSQIIDKAGYESIDYLFADGVHTDGTQTVTIFESDDPAMAGETAVVANDLLGLAAGANTLAFSNTDANSCKKVGYKGIRRYTRAKAVQTGATSGNFLSAVAVRSSPRFAPVP